MIGAGGKVLIPSGAIVVGQGFCDAERARLAPILPDVVALGVPVSIDTLKAAVAAWALDQGAAIVNDVTGGRGDPAMGEVVRRRGAGLVLMHMRGEPRTMQLAPRYQDVVGEVAAFLAERRAWAESAAGLEPDRLAFDPGVGFGKTLEQNLAILARLEEIVGLGFPVLLGVSRKSFIGKLVPSEPGERLPATIAANIIGALAGVSIIRVHDVAAHVQALKITDAIRGAS